MTTKYKVEYRLFIEEPLLTTSSNHVFSAVKIFNNPLEFCSEIANFAPDVCEEMVTDFVERNPRYAAKTFWVQQNAYRLDDGFYLGSQRISFSAFRIESDLPAE